MASLGVGFASSTSHGKQGQGRGRQRWYWVCGVPRPRYRDFPHSERFNGCFTSDGRFREQALFCYDVLYQVNTFECVPSPLIVSDK